MSGGAWDYMAAYTIGATTVGGGSGITSIYQDFFNNSTYTKYWDKYTSTSYTQYNNRILGDATGEMGPFYNDNTRKNNRFKTSWYGNAAYFPTTSSPWFARGGNYCDGTENGTFAFEYNSGNTLRYVSYRIILTP